MSKDNIKVLFLSIVFTILVFLTFYLDTPAVDYDDSPEEDIVTEEVTDEVSEELVCTAVGEEEEEIMNYPYTEEDIHMIARTLYGECRGVPSETEIAAVAWCIVNRVDAGYGETISDVVTAPYQFIGYNPSHPLDDDLLFLAEDVLIRWYSEKSGEDEVGRILPADYLYFAGDGIHNYFRNEYRTSSYWDWSLSSPYSS